VQGIGKTAPIAAGATATPIGMAGSATILINRHIVVSDFDRCHRLYHRNQILFIKTGMCIPSSLPARPLHGSARVTRPLHLLGLKTKAFIVPPPEILLRISKPGLYQ
jgi:hypothetical protein